MCLIAYISKLKVFFTETSTLDWNIQTEQINNINTEIYVQTVFRNELFFISISPIWDQGAYDVLVSCEFSRPL